VKQQYYHVVGHIDELTVNGDVVSEAAVLPRTSTARGIDFFETKGVHRFMEDVRSNYGGPVDVAVRVRHGLTASGHTPLYNSAKPHQDSKA